LSLPDLAGAAGRGGAVARAHLESEGRFEDLAFRDGPMAFGARPAERDAFLLFGYRGPRPFSLYFDCEDASAAGPARAPEDLGLAAYLPQPARLVWEYSSAEEWKEFPSSALRDHSRSLHRSGSVHGAAPPDAGTMEFFGERLFWVRARWAGGDYIEAPRLLGVFPDAVEVVQGVTRRGLPLPAAPGQSPGELELPAFPEGVAEAFERLIVETESGEEAWRRVASLDDAGAADRCFALRRLGDGRLAVRFGDGRSGMRPPAGASVRIESLRVTRGAGGNLPENALIRVEVGLSFLAGVEQLGPTRGGEDVEAPESRRRRALAAWPAGERAVTAADFRALVKAWVPRARRIDVAPDPLRPARILIAVALPAGHPPPPPALWEGLGRYLEDRSPPGTAVRVGPAAVLGAELEVELRCRGASAAAASGDDWRAALERWLAEALGAVYDPGANGAEAGLLLAPRRLRLEPLPASIRQALRSRRELRGIALDELDFVRAELVGAGEDGARALKDCLESEAAAEARCLYIEVRRIRPIIT
jgi:predicted phage baseplate assembly protein